MYMINCYDVTEAEWIEQDDVAIIEWYDIEDKEEAEAKQKEMQARYPYVQLEED